ncbi:MAG: CaiB/BaiF CoA transferase family protein [Burkholderiaceae bacterium]
MHEAIESENQSLAGQSGAASPLAGIVVLDLGVHRAGPHCALILARLGADVIKVEAVSGQEGRTHGPMWAQENNSKRSLALDIKSPQGQRVLRALARRVDVLVQNFRPGVMKSLNLDIAELMAANERLIVASVSAYGSGSVYRERPGFDGMMQAEAGLMMLNGTSDMPPLKTRPAIVDRVAGLHASIGVLAALHERARTGRGQHVDVALCQSAYSLVDAEMAGAMTTGEEPARLGNRAAGPPVNQAFQASDGWLYLCTGGRQRMWESICTMIGREDWLSDPRFTTKEARSRNAAIIEAEMQRFFIGRTVSEAIDTCVAHRVPAAPVRTVLEAAASDYVKERRVITQVGSPDGEVPVFDDPWHFSRSSVKVFDVPAVGQHTRDVMRRLGGFTDAEVEALIGEGVIG